MKGYFMWLLVLSSLVLSGCASYQKQHFSKNEAYKRGVEDAFSEIAELDRKPAVAAIDLKSNFSKLRNRVSYIVFPQKTNLTDKIPGMVEKMYWAPRQINISAQRLVTCKDLKNQTLNSLNNKVFFKNAPDEKMCAILSYTFADKPNYNVLAKDDIVEVRLYIDSDYRGYGMDYVKFVDRRTNQTVSTALDPSYPVTSGLTFMPTDIPVLAGLDIQVSSVAISPEDPFVTKHIRKLGEYRECANAATYSYRETFGSKVKEVWCSGDPLPSRIETARYLAILRNK